MLHRLKAFVKCSIKSSKGMNSMVEDFNSSRKLCNDASFKLKLNALFANFPVYFLKESTSSRQDLNRLVTHIPEIIEYGEF